MRLTHVNMFSDDAEMFNFSLRDLDYNAKYQVRSIFGLDTDEIIHKFYGFGKSTKSKFYNFGLKAREISIRSVLNPNWRNTETYSDVRDELYRLIASNRTGIITLHFNSGATTVAKIDGYITKFEVPYFAELPEVQITIQCEDPMFRGLNPIVYTEEDIYSPIENKILISDSHSTAPHGFTAQLTVITAVAELRFKEQATNPDWEFAIIYPGGFLVGDVVYLSSEFSNKSLYMMRAGGRIDLVDRIVPTSVWPIIFPGRTEFVVNNPPNLHIDNLSFYPAYWGV
ncbi:MAG: hypothetical protein ABWY25_05350 [Paenisporosarcina sp.]